MVKHMLQINFLIEEQNSNMLASIFEDYEYINLPLTYN